MLPTIVGALALLFVACGVEPVADEGSGAPRSDGAPSTGQAAGVSSSPDLGRLGPPILSKAQAIDVAVRRASGSGLLRTGGGSDIRNVKARLMTLREYEDRLTSGRSYGDRSIPVWVVTMEGEWDRSSVPGPGSVGVSSTPEDWRPWTFAVEQIDARTGRLMGSSRRFDPINLDEAEGLDPDVYARYPLETSLGYAAEVVDYPVSEPDHIPDGFTLDRVTVELAHPLQGDLSYSDRPVQSVVLHYSDDRGHRLEVAQSRGGQPDRLPGAERFQLEDREGWRGVTPEGATWLAWKATYPAPDIGVIPVTYILHSPDGFVLSDDLETVAASLPLNELTEVARATATAAPKPKVTPIRTPAPPPAKPQPIATPAPPPPHLLSYSPEPGATVGLDLQVCAKFDVTHPAMRGWDGPIRFGIAGAPEEQRRTAVDRRDDPTERSGCSSTLRKLLEGGELDSTPPTGPIEVSVRYQDQKGVQHSHSWEVDFSLDAPEAPADVRRIREVYRAVDSIDAGKGSKERTIAGYFLKDDVLHVYLLDNADPETVRTKVEAVLGEAVPPRGIRLARLNSPPDARQFNEWVDELRDLVWGADDIQLHSGSGGCCNIWDRVSYGVATVYSAHLLRQVIEQTSVPQEAVLVRVSPRATLDELSGQPTAPNGVRISLDLPKKARRGDAIPIDVVLTNTTDETVSFEYNPYLARTARIFTPDGEEVWSSHRGGVVPQPAALAELAPGEELRFTAYWSLVDQDGFALSPGRYIVRATSTFDRSVVSEPYELEVVR